MYIYISKEQTSITLYKHDLIDILCIIDTAHHVRMKKKTLEFDHARILDFILIYLFKFYFNCTVEYVLLNMYRSIYRAKYMQLNMYRYT